jgi:hypothetical protein
METEEDLYLSDIWLWITIICLYLGEQFVFIFINLYSVLYNVCWNMSMGASGKIS